MCEEFSAFLARERHAEMRAYAARQALVRAARPARRPIRIMLGTTLVRAGEWLLRRSPGWAERHAG